MRVVIGEICQAHGEDGEVRVLPVTDFPDRFFELTSVYLSGEAAARAVQRVRRHGKFFLLKLAGIKDEAEAAGLRGRRLELPPDRLVPLPAGHYYLWQIVGLRALSTGGRELGVVKEVLSRPAHDVYVVEKPGGGELLVPATRQVVVAIDLDQGQMTVKLLPGMEDGADEPGAGGG